MAARGLEDLSGARISGFSVENPGSLPSRPGSDPQATRKAFPAAEAASDEPTADLLTTRMQVHEKTAWMLRSMLGPQD